MEWGIGMDEKKVNSIDLDNTLLPYDSLTRFVWLFLTDWRCSLTVLNCLILRAIGRLDNEETLKNILIAARGTTGYENRAKRFGISLYDDMRKQMVHFIMDNTDESTVNVICTASPEDYVKHLCEKLDWKCIGTTLDKTGEHIIHTSGKNKLAALRKAFPEQEYRYNLAISDNRSDEGLLRLFKKSVRVKNGLFRKEPVFDS
jgi:phosphoserine phosphatase